MKTLDDWLATETDSDEESSTEMQPARRMNLTAAATSITGVPSTASSSSSRAGNVHIGGVSTLHNTSHTARTPTTAHNEPSSRARQEELRENMRKLLGPDVVVKAATESVASSSPVGSGQFAFPGVPPSSPRDDYSARQSSVTPMTSGIDVGATSATNATLPPPPPNCTAVEVTVVDRGTQTVSTVSTQTDPVSLDTSPIFLSPRGGASSAPLGINYLHATRCGIDGRPYRQLFTEVEQNQARSAGELRDQLDLIQNSIDMLISRYNLPPPPGM